MTGRRLCAPAPGRTDREVRRVRPRRPADRAGSRHAQAARGTSRRSPSIARGGTSSTVSTRSRSLLAVITETPVAIVNPTLPVGPHRRPVEASSAAARRSASVTGRSGSRSTRSTRSGGEATSVTVPVPITVAWRCDRHAPRTPTGTWPGAHRARRTTTHGASRNAGVSHAGPSRHSCATDARRNRSCGRGLLMAFRCPAIARTSRRGSRAMPCGSSGRRASQVGSTDPAGRCGQRRRRRRRHDARR